MAGSTFWSDTRLEPKRQFKFLFIIPSPDNKAVVDTYLIKSVDKPKVQIGTNTTVSYIHHTFKYPGRLTWTDINVTLIDTVAVDDTSSRLAMMLKKSGYIIPDTADNAKFSLNKEGATFALNKPRIQQIDAGNPMEGEDPKIIEEWTLWNAWVKSIDFGGTLNYEQDAIVNLTLGITYDWAEYTTTATGQPDYDGTGGLQSISQR